MRNYLITALVFLISLGSLWGQRNQRYGELQFQTGSMNYKGEVATSWDPGNMLRETRPYAALEYTWFVTPKFGIGGHVGYGRIYADDLNHTNPDRGISFTTDLVEMNGHLIYNFSRFGRLHRARRSTIYVKASAGLAAMHSNYPENIEFGNDVLLSPGTNGGFNLGLGLGVKYRISEKSALNLELMTHYLYSDLAEGFIVGESDGLDQYAGIRLGYSIHFF